MSKCNLNRIAAQKVGFNKVEKTQEVDFNLSADIDACVKINTKNYVSYDGDSAPVYSRLAVPQDMINVCAVKGCKNTGTLMVSPTSTKGQDNKYTHKATATFAKASNAILISSGIVYFYVDFPKAGTYSIEVTVGDIKDTELTNADKYIQTVTVTNEGYKPVSVDLSVAPTSDVGKGWTATQSGVAMEISVSYTDTTESGSMIGLSSISIFEDVDDLATNEVVKLGCLTGIEGDDTIDALEEQCQGAQYDTSTTSVERTITAQQWTPNVLKLNPLIHKTDVTEGFYIATIEATVEQDADNTEYGSVQIADSYDEECGFIYASISDSCNVNDSILTRINNPNLMSLDERQFQVINTHINPTVDVEGSKLYFDKSLIGKDVIISYPRAVEVEEYIATESGINERRAQMTYTKTQSDGVVEVHVFDNVLITSFPQTINNSDSEFSFTISIQRDKEGKFFKIMKYNKTGEYL